MAQDLDGDGVCLIVNTDMYLAIEQGNRQSQADAREAVLLVYREPATLRFDAMNYIAVRGDDVS